MAESQKAEYTLIGLGLDVVDSSFHNASYIPKQTLRAIYVALENGAFSKAILGALQAELNKVLQANQAKVKNPNAPQADVVIDFSQMGKTVQSDMKALAIKSLKNSNNYKKEMQLFKNTMSKLKKTETGIFFQNNQWVLVVAAVVVGGTALYYAKTNEAFSDKVGAKLKGKKIKVDKMTKIGKFNMDAEVLEVDIYNNKFGMSFKKLGIEWVKNKKGKSNYRKVNANLSFVGAFDGKVMITDPNLTVNFESNRTVAKAILDKKNPSFMVSQNNKRNLIGSLSIDKKKQKVSITHIKKGRGLKTKLDIENSNKGISGNINLKINDQSSGESGSINYKHSKDAKVLSLKNLVPHGDNETAEIGIEKDFESKDLSLTFGVKLSDLSRSLDNDTASIDVKHTLGEESATSIEFSLNFQF